MIRILDKNLKMIDWLRKYTFAQYQRCFRSVGTFQVYVRLEKENMYLLDRNEQFFVLFGYEDFGIVESIEKQEDSEYEKAIKISGRMALSLLTKRIVLKTFKYSGLSIEFIKNIIIKNLVNSTDNNRNLDIAVNYVYEDILKARSSKVNKTVTGGYIWDAIESVLDLDKLGIKLAPVVEPDSGDGANIKKWNLYIIPGVDRTKNNGFGNEVVVFSQSLSNIKSTEYLTDVQEYRNIAYIAGEGEGANRKWYEKQINSKDSKGLKGFLRSELWIDARDIQSEDEEGNTITEEEYETLIQNRVDEKAEENTINDTYSATIIEENNIFKYHEDYELGDFVTIIDDELGIEVTAQITEVVVSEQETGETIDIVLSYGNPQYDFTKRVKKSKQKEEETEVSIRYLEQQIRKGGGSEGGNTPSPGITSIDDLTIDFDASEKSEQINKNDPVKILFGKIAKWYNDLKTVAFTGRYGDLIDKPEIPTIPTYNGAVTTILTRNLSTKKVLVSNDSGKVAASNIGIDELSALSGVAENIQDQFDNIISNIVESVSVFVGTKQELDNTIQSLKEGTLVFISDDGIEMDTIGSTLTMIINKINKNSGGSEPEPDEPLPTWTNTANGAYKFVESNGIWASNNSKINNSSASSQWKIICKYACKVTIDWTVSSEQNYDKLTISIVNPNGVSETLVNSVSGVQSNTIIKDITIGEWTLAATYTKDNSNSSNLDKATIKFTDIQRV